VCENGTLPIESEPREKSGGTSNRRGGSATHTKIGGLRSQNLIVDSGDHSTEKVSPLKKMPGMQKNTCKG